MGNINLNNLNNGQTFKVTKHHLEKQADKPIEQMTVMEALKYKNEAQQGLQDIHRVRSTFADRHSDNGKVDILVEAQGGVAIVSGSKISLAELGQALPEYALELKKHDENDDNYITEDELSISWGERMADAGIAVGVSTAGGAATGAGIGAWFAGVGALPGAGVGALVSGIGSLLWEGGKTALYAAGDGYKSDVPKAVR